MIPRYFARGRNICALVLDGLLSWAYRAQPCVCLAVVCEKSPNKCAALRRVDLGKIT